MIEAHLEKSSCRAKAHEFGVAAGKGSGAEERLSLKPILAVRITSVLLSQQCGELSNGNGLLKIGFLR